MDLAERSGAAQRHGRNSGWRCPYRGRPLAHGSAASELTAAAGFGGVQVRTFLEVMAVKRVLHAPGIGRPDVLIDLQSVLEVRGGFGRVLLEKAAADSF